MFCSGPIFTQTLSFLNVHLLVLYLDPLDGLDFPLGTPHYLAPRLSSVDVGLALPYLNPPL